MTLTEPQVWTLIGVFSAVMVGVLSIVWAAFHSLATSLRSEMQSMRNEIMTKMDVGFAQVERRLDALDRDVQFLMRKELDKN